MDKNNTDQPAEEVYAPTVTDHETSQPVEAPVVNQETPVAQHVGTPSSPGVLILQWLTYAFWGWTAVSLWVLTGITLAYFVLGDGDSGSIDESIAYPLAAVMVLFVTALVCDMFYSRKEPVHKEKAATVIMVIHAVIFALFGIGALIVAVFSLVGLVISGEVKGPMVVFGTAMIAALIYVVLLLRTLRPRKLGSVIVKGSWAVLALIALVMIGLSVFGPVVKSVQLRDDRLIEQNLSTVSLAINDYVNDNNKLPNSLNDLADLRGEANQLIERNLVEYIKEQSPLSTNGSDVLNIQTYSPTETAYTTKYYYTLCVEYKGEKRSDYGNYGTYDDSDPTFRSSSPSTYSHDKGRVCYKLQETDYNTSRFN